MKELKRLKNIEDKADYQLTAIKNHRTNQEEIEKIYSGADQKLQIYILELQNRAIRESTENMTDEEKVFSVKINNECFRTDKHTNLTYFGNLLFKGIISLERVIEQQEKISGIINKQEKKDLSK